MSTNTPLPPAGWYPDPQGGDGQRWWNGSGWSNETRPAQAPVPPPAPPAAPAAPAYGSDDTGATGYGSTPGYGSAPGYTSTPGYAGTPEYGSTPGYRSTPGYPGTAGYGSTPGYPGTPGYAPAPPTGAWRSPVDDRPAVTGMGSAIRTVFGKYARFDGRAGRPEFWYWTLFEGIVIVGVYLILIFTVFGSMAMESTGGLYSRGFGGLSGLLFPLLWLWILGTLVPGLAVTVRRLRDAGYHWALIFLSLVPFGGIAVLVLCAMPSKYP